jgi:hypothetical protein
MNDSGELNPHNMLEAAYLLLKALKDGRLVAYNGGEPLPAEYWADKTAAALGHIKLSLKAEDVIRVFPAPAKGDA